VRLAAFASFLLGQVLLPGVFAAPFGFFVLVAPSEQGAPALLWALVVSAPTGLAAAGMMLSAGFALLRHSVEADRSARRAGWWAIGHHAAFLVALVAVAALGPAEDRAVVAAIAAFAAACIGGGALLLRAARVVAEQDGAG
jgi:hypothetical protein